MQSNTLFENDVLPAEGSQTSLDDAPIRRSIISAPLGARVLVEAGPGTGKTQLAAERLASMITSTASPGQLLVLSFSRSAVRTLTKRLAGLSADEHVIEELRHVAIRTFDSWTFRILRLLGEDPAMLLRRGYDANVVALTELILGPRRADVRQVVGDKRHLIVDEFQDLPGVRGDLVLALLDLLAPPDEPGVGFTILGDPAQAIYGFANKAGAFPSPMEYWQTVQDRYGVGLELATLTRNHRATPALAGLAAELRSVLMGPSLVEDKVKAVRDAFGDFPSVAERPSRAWLEAQPEGSAILTRTNGEAVRVLTQLLGQENEGPGVTVSIQAGSYASAGAPAWIGAMLRPAQAQTVTRTQFARISSHVRTTWSADRRERLRLPDEDVAWRRLAVASGGTEGAVSVDLAELRRRLMWPDAFPDDVSAMAGGLVVTTIHQSKGMEFDIVTVLETRPEDDDPDNQSSEEVDDEAARIEEASVGYVAVTRAAKGLQRLPSSGIYKPPSSRDFPHERTRLCHWWGGWVNLEMGQRGDVDPYGFVDPALHGGADEVDELQEFLIENAHQLDGRKVMLCKRLLDGKAVYDIHMQEERKAGKRIGRMSDHLTHDLLHLLHKRGYMLPSRILNLRISSVGTMTSGNDDALVGKERISRLWLGVGLFGTGDFKPYRRS